MYKVFCDAHVRGAHSAFKREGGREGEGVGVVARRVGNDLLDSWRGVRGVRGWPGC